MIIESIQQETEYLLTDTYISNPGDGTALFNAHMTVLSVKKNTKWAQQYIGSEVVFAECLMAILTVEKFCGDLLCVVFVEKSWSMPGLTVFNELISREKGIHCMFACQLYSRLQKPLEHV